MSGDVEQRKLIKLTPLQSAAKSEVQQQASRSFCRRTATRDSSARYASHESELRSHGLPGAWEALQPPYPPAEGSR
eukprot:765962-Hanusia_phi.AAC.3